MPIAWQLRNFDRALNVNSAASITAGFVAAVPSPCRGEILAVYVGAVDGTAIGAGPATLSLAVAGAAGATQTCGPTAAGFATGTNFTNGGPTLSAKQTVNEGDLIKATLGPGLSNAALATVTFVIRTRSL